MMNLFNLMIQQYNLNHQNQAAEVDAFQAILKHWKRKFLPSDIENNPNCCVCLDNFKFDEDVVELHCNPGSFGHIFHPDCINDWSQKQRTCPLCRKDFIDLVKQEKNNGLIHEEIKADPINLHREGNYLHPGQDVLLEIGQLNRVLINQNRIYRVDETAADEEEDSQNEGNAPYLNELPFAGGRNHRYLNQQRAPNLPESRVVLPPIQRANSQEIYNEFYRERRNMSFYENNFNLYYIFNTKDRINVYCLC